MILNNKHRFHRLEKILKIKNFENPMPGIAVIRNLTLDSQLQKSVFNFIKQNLKIAFPKTNFENTNKFLEKYYEFIKILPNKTPNGLLLFQKETQNEYNIMHNHFSKFISRYLNFNNIESLHLPINCRISDGGEFLNDKRPRSSSKWHIDVWAGEPIESFLMFLPVLGSCKSSTVRYNDCQVEQSLLIEQRDYAEHDVEGKTKNIYDLEDNTFVITDSLVFHQTLKKEKSLRISLDCRALYKEKFDYENRIHNLRQKNYFDLETWTSINKNKKIVTNFSFKNIEERTKSFKTKLVNTSYPLEFKLINKI